MGNLNFGNFGNCWGFLFEKGEEWSWESGKSLVFKGLKVDKVLIKYIWNWNFDGKVLIYKE